MKKLFHLPAKRKFLSVSVFIFCCVVNAKAQLPKFLKDASDAFKSGTEAVKNLGELINATKRTTEDFDNQLKW